MNFKQILIFTSLFISASLVPSQLTTKLVNAQGAVKKTTQETTQKTAQEQNPLSLAVSPPVSYVSVKPGEMLDHTVELRNAGSTTLKITMNITDFKPNGKTGQPILGSGSVFDKLINPDLKFGQPFTIKPGENRTANLKLQISEEAKQQEYPLTILFTAAAIGSHAGQTQFAGVVGSNLVLFVSEHKQNLGQIILEEIQAAKIVDSFSGISFSVLAKNTGQNATPIFGKASLKNFLNQTINEYIFYPDYVLANYTRLVRGTELEPDLIDSQGKLIPDKVNTLSTQFRHRPPFLIGPYWLKVDLAQESQTKLIIALPFSLLILTAAGFGILFGFKQLKKHLN